MTVNLPTWSLGSIIAVVVLILAIVLAIVGKMDVLSAILFALLAIARLT